MSSNVPQRLRDHAASIDARPSPDHDAPLCLEAADEIERLRRIHNGMHLSEGGWIYQGDGTDHVESLTCPVVITADQLRGLVECERGMQALRQVCKTHDGVPLKEQSRSSEDIALWADSKITTLQRLIVIATELAGHVNRPIALSMPFDRDVLRHWAIKFLETKREINPMRTFEDE